ncbi:bacterial alpha-L-rhamnosidase-domain-containing protein [Bisporella sp. PMI_857]|nr:bacterial alpha-L-rhamnosidase-domain-containing protein [Bisporella sp. PMI_857]
MAQPFIYAPKSEHHPNGLRAGHPRPRISCDLLITKKIPQWAGSKVPIILILGRMAWMGLYEFWHMAKAVQPSNDRPGKMSRRHCWKKKELNCDANYVATAHSDEKRRWPIRFRKKFSTRAENEVVKARVYITALGMYESYLNVTRVGNYILTPGRASYHHRLNYQTFDVTVQIRLGENVVASEVAEGCLSTALVKLVTPDAAPVRITQKIEPIDIITSPTGKTIIDFGQNLVGVVQIRSIEASLGHQVSLVHVEVPKDGEYQLALSVMQKLAGVPTKADFSALVIHTDMRRRGWFSYSNQLVNKLHENTIWGMRGNFVSIATGCPQRDERQGWIGDVQIFTSSANFLYNSVGMLAGRLRDVMDQQLAKKDRVPGLVIPNVVPDMIL